MRRVMLSILISLCFLLPILPPAQAGSDQLTIYLPRFTHGSGQQEFCAYASELMQDAGYDIEFEVFSPHSANYSSDYTEFMIDRSADADCAFVAPVSMLEPLLDEGWFDEMIPTDYAAQPSNHLALLIKTELLEEYGQPIRDASALEDWLYLRQSETGEPPLAASPFLYDRMYGGYLWLNLFLPEEGYIALNNEFSFPSVADLYASLDGEDFYGLHDLPAVSECANRYLDWMENGLIDHYVLRKAVDLSKYDALLVNTEDFISPLMLANNKFLSALDFTQYSLQIFYADELPATAAEVYPASSYAICAGQDAQAQLQDFMDWISSPSGYLLLRYGKEGVDYAMEDGRLIPSDSSVYPLWEQRVLFERSEQEPDLRKPNMPVNFHEELALLENAPDPLYSPEAFSELSQKLNESGYTAALSKVSSSNHSSCENIYTSTFTPSLRALVNSWLDAAAKADSEYAPCVDLLYDYLLH